ncbi:hypothetical protein [Kitasatospora sp. NPDC090091]|uniref:hypothetical protein n=1 Tax=Kitasatospora sp. NPDC090091 TaxID=3364081 RepID=UPI0037F46774
MPDRHEQRMYLNDVLARAEERTAARLATAADQPADLLTAAARRLREAATHAIHDGRTTWKLGNTLRSKSPVVVDDTTSPTVLIETWAQRLEAVNDYLTLVHPAVGLALADWLANEAAYQLHLAETGHDGAEDSEYALRVARAVLGQDGGQQ